MNILQKTIGVIVLIVIAIAIYFNMPGMKEEINRRAQITLKTGHAHYDESLSFPTPTPTY
jgi:hypothetical protein